MKRIIFLLAASLLPATFVFSQKTKPVNYDEAKVPAYQLPEILTMENGKEVTGKRQWEKKRRPELLALFTEQMYGHSPRGKVKTTYRTLEESESALGGRATRKQVEITFAGHGTERKVLLLLFYPNQVKGKAPVFLHFNFQGNQSVANDPAILPSQHSDYPRGHQISRWPIEQIIDAGYALATLHYEDFYPDRKDGLAESIWPLFGIDSADKIEDNTGQAISAWAWGYSRMLDYLEKDSRADAAKVIVVGHSRLGKTALWAGVQDERFAIVVSNDSGCSGAALSRRCYGETLHIMNNAFPHWLCKNYRRYNGREEELPFDQHQLLSLVAPRPLYVASATEDKWADQKGEFLSAALTGEVYRLYGYEGLGTMEMPAPDQPVMGRVGYHIRTGKHDVTSFDWESYIRFANKWLK